MIAELNLGYYQPYQDPLFCAKCNSNDTGVGMALTDNYSPMEVWELDDGSQPFWKCKSCNYEVTSWEATWTIKEFVSKLEKKHDIKVDLSAISKRPYTDIVIISNITGKIIVNSDERRKIQDELIGLVNKSLNVFAVSLSTFYVPTYQDEYKEKKTN